MESSFARSASSILSNKFKKIKLCHNGQLIILRVILSEDRPRFHLALLGAAMHSTSLRYAQNDTGGRSRNPKGKRRSRLDLANYPRLFVTEPKNLKYKGDKKMEALKKIFPLSFKYTKDVPNLIIGILIQLVVGIIAGVLIGILAKVPVVNLVVGLVGGLVDLYVIAGIVIQVLVFAKVIKE